MSEEISDGLREVRRWSYRDTLEAHIALDAADAVQRAYAEQAKHKPPVV